VGQEVYNTAKYMMLRLPVCKCTFQALLPGPVPAFRPVQPESFGQGQKKYGVFITFKPSQTTCFVPSWIFFDYMCLVQGVVGQGSYGIVKLAFKPGSSQMTFSVPTWILFTVATYVWCRE
jgi:hypothetical protein